MYSHVLDLLSRRFVFTQIESASLHVIHLFYFGEFAKELSLELLYFLCCTSKQSSDEKKIPPGHLSTNQITALQFQLQICATIGRKMCRRSKLSIVLPYAHTTVQHRKLEGLGLIIKGSFQKSHSFLSAFLHVNSVLINQNNKTYYIKETTI